MDRPEAPRAADGPGVDGLPLAGPFIGAAWNARESAVILTHEGDCVSLPLATAIALRDALSIAISIPARAAAMSAVE